jgi:cation diffusion facilitator family transporter
MSRQNPVSEIEREKSRVALVSVIAAVFLTGSKLFIGLVTGSLGILSEALHSGLDLVASLITYISVRISDRPPDTHHHYGHGKVENLSAFVETILLFLTCIWIIYEAVHRLVTGRTEIELSVWGYVVVVTSIVVDFSRSRALSRVARKYNSQALEADALHFSTDIWSSAVVLFGLICANLGYFFADSVAALVVAGIVIYVSYKLGKRSIDVLLDRVPETTLSKIVSAMKQIEEISDFHDIRIRTAGADTFVEVNIHVDPNLSIEEAHEISHRAEEKIRKTVKRCEIHVHTEPDDGHPEHAASGGPGLK